MSMAGSETQDERKPPRRRWSWSDPRSAVLAVLGFIIVYGGARRWLRAARARRAAAALTAPGLTPEEILNAADVSAREGLIELFRLLETAGTPDLRAAAGEALARLWARDELVIEEEKAIVVRGYEVTWRARRKYPRGMTAPIPIEARFGVPFLKSGGPGVGPANLEWSYQVTGAQRVALETFSAWVAGPGTVRFEIEPGDFTTNGPHRLVLRTRVRTIGLTDHWEHELPHIPFTFEFDPLLSVDALLAMPDQSRAEVFERSVRLAPPDRKDDETEHAFLDLNAQWTLRDPPEMIFQTPLPCDLAHSVALEFEGIPGSFSAGMIHLHGQSVEGESGQARRALGPIRGFPESLIDRPGERSLRAILTADPDRGWADPDARSIWPGTITTDWCPVTVLRR